MGGVVVGCGGGRKASAMRNGVKFEAQQVGARSCGIYFDRRSKRRVAVVFQKGSEFIPSTLVRMLFLALNIRTRRDFLGFRGKHALRKPKTIRLVSKGK